MTRKDIRRDWPHVRRDIKRRWPLFAQSDIEMIAGDRERLVVRIVERYGIAKEWAERQVSQWEENEP